MTLTDRIAAILAAARTAARPAAGPERRLGGASAAERVAAVLAEVGETVLPRALTFSGSDGSRVTIEARGRRLAKLTAAEGAPAHVGWEVALAAAESDPAAELAQLARMIAAFAEAADRMTVSAGPSTLPASFVRPGHPTEALAREIGGLVGSGGAVTPAPEPAAHAPPDGAIGIFAALDAAGHPTVRCSGADGRILRTGHDAEGAAARLSPVAARLAAAAEPFAEDVLPGPRLVFLSDRNGALPTLCHAREGEDAITGTPTAAAIDALAAAWRLGLAGAGT